MTVEKISDRYQIEIPLQVREALGLKPGDAFEIKAIDETVVMVPLPVGTSSHTDRLFGKHRTLWSGEDAVAYIRKERESWRD